MRSGQGAKEAQARKKEEKEKRVTRRRVGQRKEVSEEREWKGAEQAGRNGMRSIDSVSRLALFLIHSRSCGL